MAPGEGSGDGFLKSRDVLTVGDIDAAELLHVIVGVLRVEQFKAAVVEPVDEVDEADFGGVGAAEVGAREHGFAEERAVDMDAVQPADEPTVEKGFDGMGVAGVKESGVARDEAIIDPGAIRIGTRGGAPPHDAIEGGVAANVQTVAADFAGQ